MASGINRSWYAMGHFPQAVDNEPFRCAVKDGLGAMAVEGRWRHFRGNQRRLKEDRRHLKGK